MVDNQVKQGNKADVEIFQKCASCDKRHGGFEWHKSTEGWIFWFHIIDHKKFDEFFKKYETMEKIIIGNVTIKPGMLLYLNNTSVNSYNCYIVFPKGSRLAAVSFKDCEWAYLSEIKDKITAIRDFDDESDLLNHGEILWSINNLNQI